MSTVLKSEYGYDDFDFIEVDGQLKELTVTITLNEYRDLICRKESMNIEIDNLLSENSRLKTLNKELSLKFLNSYPELAKSLKDSLDLLDLSDMEMQKEKQSNDK